MKKHGVEIPSVGTMKDKWFSKTRSMNSCFLINILFDYPFSCDFTILF